ncbi:hypothetical protein ASG73_07065 [Janibacter sp. Soil728]|uniref:DUF4328 domain-containing protein n=1 Tax=Janibacter sp. Soil728 TaxID=1736393 RepID=UPI0006F7DE25|nr:DUF4328 domain-containing protein [Janibacter sp. Soil728]KRE37436.1 hypothetical protein ASG73_07065 [Janibacter sp. Soil728]
MSQITGVSATTSIPRPPVTAPVLSGRLAVGAAVGWTLVAVASAVVALVTKGEMQAYVEGAGDESRGFVILTVLGGVQLVLMSCAWLAGSVWLLGVRGVARAVAPHHPYRRSDVWAVLGWIVPIVSLWFPLQVVSDSLSAMRGATPRRLLTIWWTAWLVAIVLGNASSRMGADLMTPDQVGSWVLGTCIAALLLLVALPTWWAVVASVSRDAHEAAHPPTPTAAQTPPASSTR